MTDANSEQARRVSVEGAQPECAECGDVMILARTGAYKGLWQCMGCRTPATAMERLRVANRNLRRTYDALAASRAECERLQGQLARIARIMDDEEVAALHARIAALEADAANVGRLQQELQDKYVRVWAYLGGPFVLEDEDTGGTIATAPTIAALGAQLAGDK